MIEVYQLTNKKISDYNMRDYVRPSLQFDLLTLTFDGLKLGILKIVTVARHKSGVFHHLTVTTRSTKLRPRHAFISLFGVNLCTLVYQNLPESDSSCFCGNQLVYQAVFHAVVYR